MAYPNLPVLVVFSKAACGRQMPSAVEHGWVTVCFLLSGLELARVDAERCLLEPHLGCNAGEAAEIAGL